MNKIKLDLIDVDFRFDWPDSSIGECPIRVSFGKSEKGAIDVRVFARDRSIGRFAHHGFVNEEAATHLAKLAIEAEILRVNGPTGGKGRFACE